MNEIIALIVFISPGLIGEAVYSVFKDSERENTDCVKVNTFTRMFSFVFVTLFLRLVISYLMGHSSSQVEDIFLTIRNLILYVLLSVVSGLLLPNIYILFEEDLLPFLKKVRTKKNKEIVQDEK